VLTTVVATPCGAPFASTAFGYALVAPAPAALAVFAALGLGLAAPVLLAALWPGLAAKLPKPGPWMVELKQLLAIPLIGAAGWMAWTYSAMAGSEAAFVLLVVFIPVLIWLAWSWGRWQAGQAGAGWRTLIAALSAVVLAGWMLTAPRPPAPGAASATAAWQPWTPAVQAELTRTRTAMLIDATAAWCLTCQVNKRTTLNDPAVLAEATQRGVRLLRADFTNRDPALAAELQRHGRVSVPTYLLIAPDGSPTVLPDLLTPGIIHDAFASHLGSQP
jgi:thiol:disulfide interchange protein